MNTEALHGRPDFCNSCQWQLVSDIFWSTWSSVMPVALKCRWLETPVLLQPSGGPITSILTLSINDNQHETRIQGGIIFWACEGGGWQSAETCDLRPQKNCRQFHLWTSPTLPSSSSLNILTVHVQHLCIIFKGLICCSSFQPPASNNPLSRQQWNLSCCRARSLALRRS